MKLQKFHAQSILPRLVIVAGNYHLETIWTPDPYFKWDGDGPAPKRKKAHDVQVRVSVISGGEMHSASAYLGGCYCPPGKPDPDIHGYWLQMVEECLTELPDGIEKKGMVLNIFREAMADAHEHQMFSKIETK